MKKNILFFIFLWSILFMYGQGAGQNEQLKNNINRYPQQDTHRANALLTYIRAEIMVNSNHLLPYIEEAIAISKKTKYNYGLRKGMISAIIYYGDRGNFEQSFLYADTISILLRNDNSEAAVTDMGFLYLNIGNNYFKKGDLPNAASSYMTAVYHFLKVNNLEYAARSYLNISGTYESLNDTAKAFEFTMKAREVAKTTKNERLHAGIQISYIADLLNKGEYQKAELELNEIEPIVNRLNNSNMLQSFYYYKALCSIHTNSNFTISFYKQSLHYAHNNEDTFQIADVMIGLANYFLGKKEMISSKIYLDSLLILADNNELELFKKRAYDGLEQWNLLAGNSTNAKKFKQLSQQISEKLLSEEKKKQIEAAAVNLSIKEKETEIEKLKIQQENDQLKLKQKTILNYILAGSIFSILIIFFLGYRTYQQKQKLQKQQITELQKEKQLLAAEAVLKGQVEERTRLAKDLHDGLGGMLSGIKYSFNTMKENLILTAENALAFERSMNMLDSSIKELRMVAHNLMPESLMKFGLDTALKDFCGVITSSGALKVNYHSFGMKQNKIDQNTEVILYRIVQELINNSIKHAQAKEAIVQLQLQNNQLEITVEDDGKGFDMATLDKGNGIGWSNIKNRAEYLKAKLSLQSKSGEGTSVSLVLEI